MPISGSICLGYRSLCLFNHRGFLFLTVSPRNAENSKENLLKEKQSGFKITKC